MSLALSTALWAESPEKKGLDVINRSTAEAHIGFLADDDLEGAERQRKGQHFHRIGQGFEPNRGNGKRSARNC